MEKIRREISEITLQESLAQNSCTTPNANEKTDPQSIIFTINSNISFTFVTNEGGTGGIISADNELKMAAYAARILCSQSHTSKLFLSRP